METFAYIGAGSNLGDLRQNLRKAVSALAGYENTSVTKVSSLYKTTPVGFIEQTEFLNAVLELKTSMDAHALLDLLKRTERDLGREKTVKWGPRVIDLDILLFGRHVIMDQKLAVPHPELVRRKFVLVPLVEINGEAMHPVLEKRAKEIWNGASREIKDQKVELFEGPGWHV